VSILLLLEIWKFCSVLEWRSDVMWEIGVDQVLIYIYI